MSQAPVSKPLPARGDPWKFAQQGVTLSGLVPLASLLRLALALREPGGDARAELRFGRDEQGRRVLTGSVEAELPLECQRCLETVLFPVRSEFALALVADDETAASLPQHLEPWIVTEDQASFHDVIEEELLLSLPTVAVHPEPCIDEGLMSRGDAVADEPRKNPFQVLEQLKGKRK